MANEMINESVDNASQGVVPTPTALGLPSNDPAAIEAMNGAIRLSGRDYARIALQSAGAGVRAGQGQINPTTAFLEGAAMGVQIPAQVYQEKQAQMKSQIDATPFGVVVPDAKNIPGLQAFVGLPYGLVAPAIQQIAVESVKAFQQGEFEKQKKELEMKGPTRDFKSEQDMALDFNKLPEVQEYKGVRSAYRQMNSAPLTIKNEKGEIIPNPAGQMALMSGYVKMMFPQARQNEGTLSLAEVGSLVDQNTLQLFQKAMTGSLVDKAEVNKLMAAARAKNKSVTKQYQNIADIWGDTAEERGFNSEFVLSGDRGTGESLEDIFNSLQAQYPNMSKAEIFAIMKAQGN